MKNHTFELLGFYQILKQLKEFANTAQAREMLGNLEPYLGEMELGKNLRDTTQARQMLEQTGNPPIPEMNEMGCFLDKINRAELLSAEEIEQTGMFLRAVRRLRSYLETGKEQGISLAYYGDSLTVHEDLAEKIERSVRGGRIEDSASKTLKDIRRELLFQEQKIKEKAESILKANKSWMSDTYVVKRNGRICLPVSAQYRKRVEGTEVDRSATGSTIFVEPSRVTRLCDECEQLRFAEAAEEKRILYSLMNRIGEHEAELRENMRVVIRLDFVFAKGKLSAEMQGMEPEINTERRIRLKKARHPMLPREQCVPLDFAMGENIHGVIITGPNTGGKTVAIKTVGLLSLMACSGLHVPAEEADITMNSQILCDIGDGQDIKDNLSTFSAHMMQMIDILKKVNEESLVILDELGSGTDPAEGMGIAIAILEQLRQSGALFLVTTHYPEVKEYVNRFGEIISARMAFDRESMQPLYRLEMGKTGDSCALYIARRLGLPGSMIRQAAREAYGDGAEAIIKNLNCTEEAIVKEVVPRIRRIQPVRRESVHGEGFDRGDSVIDLRENKIGIVVKPADGKGNVLIQVSGGKYLVNHKRLKLKVAAKELYPEDYDFSIVFDSVENRKARHRMGKRHEEGLEIYTEE